MSEQIQLWPRNKTNNNNNNNDVQPFHFGKRRYSKRYSRKYYYGKNSNLASPNESPESPESPESSKQLDVPECENDRETQASPTNSVNSTDSYDDVELNNLIKNNNNNRQHQNKKNEKNEKKNQIIKNSSDNNNNNNNKQIKLNNSMQVSRVNKNEIEKMFDQIESPIVKNIAKKFAHDFYVLNKCEQIVLINTLSAFMHNRKKRDLNKNILEFVIEQIEYFQQNTCTNPNYANSSKNNQRKINCLIKGQLINPKIKFVSESFGNDFECKLNIKFKCFEYNFVCSGKSEIKSVVDEETKFINILNANVSYNYDFYDGSFDEEEKQILSQVFNSHYIQQECEQWLNDYANSLLVHDSDYY